MSFNLKWNALDSQHVLCMLISKLPGGIMGRWNRKVPNIRKCQVREATLDDMTEFIEEETILMNGLLFSCEELADYLTKLERTVKQKRMKNYTIKVEDENDKKDVKGSSEGNSSRCKICNGQHDLDECKAFNDIAIEERSKFLSKQKLCHACYEAISPKHKAKNCPKRRNCKICLAKHPTGLYGCKIRRKDDSKSDNDPGNTISKTIVPDQRCSV